MRPDIVEKITREHAARRLNLLREEMQWQVLTGLHQSEAFRAIAFIGGTSLRLLRNLGRFSEDLDFSTHSEGVDRDALEQWGRAVLKQMEGCAIPGAEFLPGRGTGAVLSADIRLPGILKEVGLSPLSSAKLRIKIEIDTRPPAGAELEKLVVSHGRLLAVTTYERPSLMAGKLHVLLARRYTKGRDWYDLLWYCGERVAPNVTLLQNALEQVPSPSCRDASAWREAILALAAETDWKAVHRDVGPFLEHSDEIALLNADTVQAALRG